MEKQELMLTNRNGKRMPATLRMPSKAPQGTAVVTHGLAGWMDQSLLVATAESLCDSGYITVSFEASDGRNAPDKSYKNSTTTGHLHDLEDVIEYIHQQEWYTGPLVLAGHSLGALISLTYAKYHPGVSHLILIAPSTAWYLDNGRAFLKKIRFIADAKNSTSSSLVPMYPKWILDFLQYDARKCAPHVSVPALVISAEKDVLVAPPSVHEQLAGLFPNGTHVVIKGASHTFSGHEQELAATITSWLTSS